MQVITYRNSNKFHEYTVQKDGVPYDLIQGGVTRIEVAESGKSIDSTSANVTFTGSTLRIKWSALNLPEGTYEPTVWVYTTSNPEGEVLYGPLINPISLTFLNDEREHKVKISGTVSSLVLQGPTKPINRVVVANSIIDFSLYNGSLSALSNLPMVLSGVSEEIAISPVVRIPVVTSFRFRVHYPNTEVFTYIRKWLI